MPIPLTVTDPAHGRPLPTGRQLAGALKRLLARQAQGLLWATEHGTVPALPRLSAWSVPMADALSPLVLGHYQAGGADSLRRIRAAVRARKSLIDDAMSVAFSVFNRRAADAARQLTLAFCDATNATSTMKLEQALEATREQLAQGLERGEALKTLGDRVRRIFADPARAFRIAQTEASRAVHAGQQSLARETGLVRGKRWLASSDACDFCKALGGKEVGIEETFTVREGGGPYAPVYHPPGHPGCMCSFVEVLA